MRIYLLLLDDVFDTGVSVLMDTLNTANELAVATGLTLPLIEVKVVGVRRRVRTAMGFTRLVEHVRTVTSPDWIVVPALNAKQPERLVATLGRRDVQEAVEQLRKWHALNIPLAAACISTFLLAEAGILNESEATTSWPLTPLFRQRYPRVQLDDSRMIAVSTRIVTAGAALGHLDLALWLVRQVSPQLAELTAKFMLIDKRSSQAHYIVPDYMAHADPLVARFERWAREHLAEGFSLQDAANALAVGPRTLQRRMEAVLGKSPLAFFQDLRVQRAEQLVAEGYDPKEIATAVGYADSATLRTLLRRKTGRGIRELRADVRN